MKTRIFLLMPLLCAALAGLQAAEPTTTTNTAKYWAPKSASTFAPNSNAGGRLIVGRAANFGTRNSCLLSIDGKVAMTIKPNERFDGLLSAGDHVISVRAVPDLHFGAPTSIRLTVKPGETYVFTGVWESDQVVLRRVPTTP